MVHRVSVTVFGRVRDFAEVKGDGVVTAAPADEARICCVDKQGFDAMDRRLLAIMDRFVAVGWV